MRLISTNKAIQYINEKKTQSKEELVILIYQYNKQSCVGSYLDFFVELTPKKSIYNQEIYENWQNIGNSANIKFEIYIEKRLIDEWKKDCDVSLDLNTTYKFKEKFDALELREIPK